MAESAVMDKQQIIVQLEIKKYEDKQRGEFNEALAKFQQRVKAPKKNGHVNFSTKKGGKTKYDYVMLDDLIKAINEGLKDTGISWSQNAKTETVKSGNYPQTIITVSTVIHYKNGYQIESSPVEMVSTKGDPQSVGAVITYAKRYSLSAAFGVNSDEDNDGYENENNYSSRNSSNSYHTQHSPNNNQHKPANQNNQESEQQKNFKKFVIDYKKVTGMDDWKDIVSQAMAQLGFKESLGSLSESKLHVLNNKLNNDLNVLRNDSKEKVGSN